MGSWEQGMVCVIIMMATHNKTVKSDMVLDLVNNGSCQATNQMTMWLCKTRGGRIPAVTIRDIVF